MSKVQKACDEGSLAVTCGGVSRTLASLEKEGVPTMPRKGEENVDDLAPLPSGATMNDENSSAGENSELQAGRVFIGQGTQMSIPEGGLTIRMDPDGGFVVDPVAVHVRFDTWPMWLQLGLEHLAEADRRHLEVLDSCRGLRNDELGCSLEAECRAGMQAIVASGIAIDAFYAVVKERISIPKEKRDAWRRNGTARYKQIAEVVDLAFNLDSKGFERVRQLLKEITRFRDWAVHPSAQSAEPVQHPELGVGVEWRFVAFGFQNARSAVRVSLALIAQMLPSPRKKHAKLDEYCRATSSRIHPLVREWEGRYGKLLNHRDAQSKKANTTKSGEGESRTSGTILGSEGREPHFRLLLEGSWIPSPTS